MPTAGYFGIGGAGVASRPTANMEQIMRLLKEGRSVHLYPSTNVSTVVTDKWYCMEGVRSSLSWIEGFPNYNESEGQILQRAVEANYTHFIDYLLDFLDADTRQKFEGDY